MAQWVQNSASIHEDAIGSAVSNADTRGMVRTTDAH